MITKINIRRITDSLVSQTHISFQKPRVGQLMNEIIFGGEKGTAPPYLTYCGQGRHLDSTHTFKIKPSRLVRPV